MLLDAESGERRFTFLPFRNLPVTNDVFGVDSGSWPVVRLPTINDPRRVVASAQTHAPVPGINARQTFAMRPYSERR
jgi:hypothetical protein